VEGKGTELTNLKLLLAQLHALQGNVGAALTQSDEILTDNPKDFRPYLCKGLVLSLAGEGRRRISCSRSSGEVPQGVCAVPGQCHCAVQPGSPAPADSREGGQGAGDLRPPGRANDATREC